MLIPFLPYLIALASMTAMLGLAADTAALPIWSIVLLYGALPLLGAAVGQVPERWLGGRRRTYMRRRLIFLAGWLGILGWSALPAVLRIELDRLLPGESAAIVLLALNFWLGDTLAASPLRRFPQEGWRNQIKRFGQALRLPVPVLILMLAGLALPVFSDDLLVRPMQGDMWRSWLQLAGSLGFMVVLAVIVVPVLIRTCWGLQPLPQGSAREAIEAELNANGTPVAAVLAWPDAMMGHATAGVIGLLPRFRYLLISPALAGALPPEELRSVTAHEAGHLKHRHLWYFLAAMVSFILAMQVLATGLFWVGLFTGAMPPLWSIVVLEVVALVAFFRFGIGFVSRHFERQADGNALRCMGASPFEGAIRTVGQLNGIPPEQDNWHHYGIGRRIAYAHLAEAEPERLGQHDRRVGRIKLALVTVLLITLGAQATASHPQAMGWLGERLLAHQLAGSTELSDQHLLSLQFLATRAVQRGDHTTAERYFRAVIDITPDDPQAQNNLAWVLVTQPEAQPGDLREGLRLARSAAELDDQAYIWDTLAESYFRMEQYDDAVHAAQKALVLAERGAGRGEAPLTYYRDRLAAFARFGRGA